MRLTTTIVLFTIVSSLGSAIEARNVLKARCVKKSTSLVPSNTATHPSLATASLSQSVQHDYVTRISSSSTTSTTSIQVTPTSSIASAPTGRLSDSVTASSASRNEMISHVVWVMVMGIVLVV